MQAFFQLLASYVVRGVIAPLRFVAGAVVQFALKAIWNEILSAYEKYLNKKKVEEIKKAEDALSKAGTDEQKIDESLDDIANNTRR